MGLFSCFDANKEDKADAVEQRRRDTDLRKRRDAPGDNMVSYNKGCSHPETTDHCSYTVNYYYSMHYKYINDCFFHCRL